MTEDVSNEVDTLSNFEGGAGSDYDDELQGNTGANKVFGGFGGDDTYVTDGGDTIVEAAGKGTDSVRSSVSHTLSANVENLTLTGTGNCLANVITGNTGINELNGGGDDRLTGGGP